MKTKIFVLPTFGDSGNHVEIVQRKLAEAGIAFGNIDGSFGKLTKNAIIQFQNALGIEEDGLLNSKILEALNIIEDATITGDALIDIPNIVDRSKIAKIFWTNGDRGHAAYGFYYGMCLTYANFYTRFKNNDELITAICKPLNSDLKKDALTKCSTAFEDVGLNNNTAENRLRNLFILMLGLAVMESNGRHCCGWDRGKLTGWNGKGTPIAPTSSNSESGLFQTSYDILGSVNTSTRNLLIKILSNYTLENEGFLPFFAKGVKIKPTDIENYCDKLKPGDCDGKEKMFQQLAKDCPAFTVEFTAMCLRNISNHWNPVVNIGDPEDGLQIKMECNNLLLSIENYVNSQQIPKIDHGILMNVNNNFDNLKTPILIIADAVGQKKQLEKLFAFAPTSKANYWAVVDFNKPRTEERLFIFSLNDGTVKKYHVSHGKNSGDLFATDLSNEIGSNKSCKGIFTTKNTYIGGNGRSLILDGLEASNNNAKKRLIVLHKAPYVTTINAGKSLGCFVVSIANANEVIDHLKEGSYLLAWRN